MERKSGHIDFLDHLRGVAILGVFLFHCVCAVYPEGQIAWTNGLPDFHGLSIPLVLASTSGIAGVAIFFVVSGFCIHLSHRRSSAGDFTTFFIRRFFRIYPPYLVALLLCYFLLTGTNHNRGVAQLLSHLFLVHNLSTQYFFGINGVFWSIAVEVQLYLLYPLLLVLVRRFTWPRAILLLAGLELALRGFDLVYSMVRGETPMRLLTGSPFYFWFSWSIGAWAAEAFLTGAEFPLRRVPVWLFPLGTLVATFVQPLLPFIFPLAALSTVSVIGYLLRRFRAGPIPGASVLGEHLRFAGLVSYSFYLLHQPMVRSIPLVLARFGIQPGAHPLAVFAICLASWLPLIWIAWVFYRLLELPSIAAGKWVLRRRAALSVVA